MPEHFVLKLKHNLKKFFEEYIEKNREIEFNNVTAYLRNLIINHKNDLKMNLYNLTISKKIIEIFDVYVKNNPDLGYINGDEYIREIIRNEAEKILKTKEIK